MKERFNLISEKIIKFVKNDKDFGNVAFSTSALGVQIVIDESVLMTVTPKDAEFI
ncbi:MAG: hypothetical protein KKD35_03345 [Elusimicrobia bacterium]|nr:hypothetical protein [Elusimicrobiota bacterium]